MSVNSASESLCCVVIRKVQNDLKILQYEMELLQSIKKQSSRLLMELNDISLTINCKLQLLWLNKIPPNERESYCMMRRDKVTEFIDFLENVRQFGSSVIRKSLEKITYISFVEGVPLSITLQRVNDNLQSAGYNLSGNNDHAQCTQTFLAIYNEIVNNLMPRLSNADFSFCYYSMIKRNIAFSQELSNLIDKFLKRPKNHSVFLFCQELLNQCPPLKYETSCDFFSQLTDYLTGRLMQETDYLDHHSDIQPIAVDRTHSRNQFLVKQMTSYLFKLIPLSKINSKMENLLKTISLSNEDSSRQDGRDSSLHNDNHHSPELENPSEDLPERRPKKRGRKSKGCNYEYCPILKIPKSKETNRDRALTGRSRGMLNSRRFNKTTVNSLLMSHSEQPPLHFPIHPPCSLNFTAQHPATSEGC